MKKLLKFSRKHKQNAKNFFINEVIEGIIIIKLNSYSKGAEKIIFNVNYSESNIELNGDPGQLDHVISNIIKNAQQSILKTGEHGNINIEVSKENNNTKIVIENDGPQIDKDHLNKLFDPFFTTKSVGEGTGLGLSLSYGIIKELKGEIKVTNIKEYKMNANIEGLNVLIIDDEPTVLELLSEILNKNGVNVKSATNGKDGLTLVNKNSFDIILSDIKMPEMDGYEFALWLKDNKPSLLQKTVFVTGLVSDEIDQLSILYGCKILSKPFTENDITKTIQNVLNYS